jgi:phage-related protein
LFFGRLFEAFGPFAVEMLDGLSEITAGWADWADGIGETQGFTDFLDYAREVGPQVLDMLGSFVDAVIAIGEALAPLAGPALTAFTAIFNAIANAPTGLLTTLIVLFGGLFLAVQGFTAIGQAYRATVAAMGVATSIFGGIMSVVQGIMAVFRTAWMLLNLAFTASPIGVIIVALIALVAVFVILYKKVDWFRAAVDAVVKAVVDAFQWLYDQLWGHSILKDLVEAFQTAFKWIKDAIMVPIKWVIGWLKTIFNGLVGFYSGLFSRLNGVIRGGWNTIKTIWKNAVDAVKAALKLVFDTIPAYIREKFDRVMEIVRGLKDRITGFFSGAATWLINAGWNIIKGLVTGIRDAASSILQGTLDWVTDKIPDWKGPRERDEKLLRPTGGYIIGGLVGGLLDQVPSLESTLGGITNKIAATSAGISATLDARGTLPAGAATAGSGMTVNVISPSRLRVDEGLATGLKRVAAVAGYST